jgi:serine/threonine protein kinase
VLLHFIFRLNPSFTIIRALTTTVGTMATNTNPRTGRGRSRYSDMDSQGGILAALDSHVNTSDTRKLATKGQKQMQKQASRTQNHDRTKQQQPRRSIATSPTLDDSKLRKKAAAAPPTSVIFSTDADTDDDDDDDVSESSMSVLSSSMSSPLASTSSSPALPVNTKTQPLRRNIMYPRSSNREESEDDDSDEEESDDMTDDNDEEEDSDDEQVKGFQHAVDKHNKRSNNAFSGEVESEEEDELTTASSEEEEEEEEEVLSEEEYDPESDAEATLTDDEELADEVAALDEEDEEIKRKLKKPSKTKAKEIRASLKNIDMNTDNDEVQVIESPTKDAVFSPDVSERKKVNNEQNDSLDPNSSTASNKSVEDPQSGLDESCDVVEVYLCDDDDDDDDDDVLAATVYYDDIASDTQAPSNDDDDDEKEVLSETQRDQSEEEEEESYDGGGDGTAAFLSDDKADEKEMCPTEKELSEKVESPMQTQERKQNESQNAVLCEEENAAAKKPATALSSIHTPPRQQRGRPRQRQGRREGNIQRGKWSLGSKIGSGAFGVVHIGMNTATGALMAVKSVKMDRAVMKDVRREIDLLRSLKHTNIVRYHGAEMDKTHLHIFQEWVAGGSVTGMLAKFGPFSIDVLRSYLSQTLNGLAYLHENNIMHRDIKGSNILVSDEGIVKLADFGASKRLENAQKDMMQSLTMRGTPYFMAVEVFEEKYSMKADVWSVGCVAIQMATGSPPWKSLGYSNPVALFSHLKSHNDPPPIEIASKDINPLEFGLLKSVVAKCFKRDPSDRPSVKSLQHDPFFSEVHTLSDDDHSVGRGLFSPESHCSWEVMHSPIAAKLSPIPSRSSRSNSVGPRRSPFMSPPLPKRTGTGLRASPAPLSPQPDTNEWPTWAREKYESSTAAAAAPTAQGLAKLGKTDALTGKMIDLMGSLALSDDSCMVSPPFCGSNRESSVFRRSSTVQSPLEGLQFAGYNSSLGGASPAGN